MSEEIFVYNTEDSIKPIEIKSLPIYTENHSALAVNIPEYTGILPNPIMSSLIKKLQLTRKKYNGVGLAANQCGILERVFVIGTETFEMSCINPKIVNHSESLVTDKEGCLTFPGLYLKIPRYNNIDVEFMNEYGKILTMTIGGLTARVFQHELDHLNGITFTSKVGSVSLRMAKERQRFIHQKVQRKFM